MRLSALCLACEAQVKCRKLESIYNKMAKWGGVLNVVKYCFYPIDMKLIHCTQYIVLNKLLWKFSRCHQKRRSCDSLKIYEMPCYCWIYRYSVQMFAIYLRYAGDRWVRLLYMDSNIENHLTDKYRPSKIGDLTEIPCIWENGWYIWTGLWKAILMDFLDPRK